MSVMVQRAVFKKNTKIMHTVNERRRKKKVENESENETEKKNNNNESTIFRSPFINVIF